MVPGAGAFSTPMEESGPDRSTVQALALEL
jgi:hypothetical protein